MDHLALLGASHAEERLGGTVRFEQRVRLRRELPVAHLMKEAIKRDQSQGVARSRKESQGVARSRNQPTLMSPLLTFSCSVAVACSIESRKA